MHGSSQDISSWGAISPVWKFHVFSSLFAVEMAWKVFECLLLLFRCDIIYKVMSVEHICVMEWLGCMGHCNWNSFAQCAVCIWKHLCDKWWHICYSVKCTVATEYGSFKACWNSTLPNFAAIIKWQHITADAVSLH